jgi:hypothetical protein
VSPFAGIVADGKLGASGVFEPSVLVAMLAYFVGAVLLMSIAWAVRSTRLAFPADPGNPPEFRRQVP